MARLRPISSFLAVAALAAACIPLAGQTSDRPASFQPGKLVVQRTRLMPFPAGPGTMNHKTTVEFRSVDEMTPADRNLADGARSAIAARAGFADIGFNQGRWTYRQIVCPAFPNHLFLRFTRNNGVGDVSMFSVSIPRGGEGRVRVIPILRRSYSLFSPAPVNAMTIAAFNRIRAEDPAPRPFWLESALCYAALAGADPQAGPLNEDFSPHTGPADAAPLMKISRTGQETVTFTDWSARPRPMFWSMTFGAKGALLKVTRLATSPIREKPVPPSSPELSAKPIPQATKPIKFTTIEQAAPGAPVSPNP
ncbi:MAG: hypothetical protein ACRD27_03695 [Terracidiphilus sp.]